MGMWIWRDIFGNRNSPEAIMQAAQYCEQLREQCLHDRQSLIFETVLSSDGKVDFICRAKEMGYLMLEQKEALKALAEKLIG